jgi:CelD/BcsL family acetyltransferase involved in cellulose biosynthesis
MATAGLENGTMLDVAARIESRRSLWRGPRFIAEVFDGADDALAALEAVQGGLVSTGFQTLNWLTVLYEELASAEHALPRVVIISERNTGEVALILPLLISKKRSLTIARFADLGVSDYGSPILGPVILEKSRSIRRVWRAVRKAMPDVDLIRLERMPAEIGGRTNPLLTRRGITPARHPGNVLTIPDTVEAFLRSRGKKYRKEVERCTRLWEKEGAPRFYRATTPEQIARAYSVLEEQQASRHGTLGSTYVLDKPAYAAFYERLAIDGSDAGLASLFALEANGEIIATLFGIVHDGTFTLLRIATGGNAWSHLSPGRLVVVEAMKHFVAQDVRRFDMGIGDYPFKRGFGAEKVPLYDLIVARGLSAEPAAIYHRLKGRLRRNEHLRAVFQRLKPYFGR